LTVFAAGALCWREIDGEIRLALVHRGRYNDWSWPKGKVDPGETLPQTAVREIAEETGLSIKLGQRIHISNYIMPNGAHKEVHYWAARVSDAVVARSKFKPDDEVAEVRWVTVAEARALLTYEYDHEVLDKLVALYQAGTLRTKPVIVLRHGSATLRADWKGEEVKRPLTPIGAAEAATLAPTLAAFNAKRIYTSPWYRCHQTVEPYAQVRGLIIIERSQLSEMGESKGPQRTRKMIHKVVLDGRPSVLCTHRPALPTILDSLAEFGNASDEIILHQARALKPGEMMVVHLTPLSLTEPRRIVAIEFYEAASPLG
jgi:8-oxo-(d)GTP phosphatase